MLVTNVGGLSEIVLHQKVGYVVEKNPKKISEAIYDFFQNKRNEQFKPFIKEEKKKYTWGAFVDKLIELYNQL